MNNQKGIAPIIVILVLVAIIGGGTLVWQNFSAQKEEVEISEGLVEDETTDWQRYNNENGGYGIKYPPDLLIKHTIAEIGKTWPNFMDSLEINSENSLTNPVEWRIEVWKNTDGLSAQQRAEQIGGATLTRNKVITKIIVGGVEGRKVVIDYLPSDVDPENTIKNAISIFLIKDETIYEFFCVNKITKKSGIQDYNSYQFNQMLSTFKFLEVKAPEKIIEDETADWQTYRNEEYGFEVEYPENSKIVDVNETETHYKYAKYEKNIFHVVNIQNIDDLYTRVGFYVDNDEKNLKICLKTLMEDQNLTETKEINGIKFYIYKNYQPDNAMGGFRARVSEYHTIYNNRCYRIESVVHWTDVSVTKGATTGESATQEEIEEQENQIAEKKAMVDGIVSTFKFSQSR